MSNLVLIPSLSGHIFKSAGFMTFRIVHGLNPFFIRSYIQIEGFIDNYMAFKS